MVEYVPLLRPGEIENPVEEDGDDPPEAAVPLSHLLCRLAFLISLFQWFEKVLLKQPFHSHQKFQFYTTFHSLSIQEIVLLLLV